MTFERIDAAYLAAAELVEMHGEAYLPIFERLADERDAALARGYRLREALTRLRGRR
ncbi:hypothetical protein SAMN04488498_1088 [Mesorhizobium albiziae]|uniref:Uncharacterized protein n=1 Tax=Neomesorhizobium albiziae TaxID=335020 RepID=A0A1I4AFM3_9HYPH|nr:hypothetical protein [Mesorhizobium albiziae]GLS32807.1 hypothetical protein GCM10007937_45170 [Mesorhizobium albiziae]SFK54576.1 hypothetical protein SAMN04488498_1088 [Mesorhizobium albiziae]